MYIITLAKLVTQATQLTSRSRRQENGVKQVTVGLGQFSSDGSWGKY